jgi:hypothetical protein
MIRLEFNGKPFDAKSFEERVMKAAMQSLADDVRQKLSAIRDPETGEFPTVVVRATSMTAIRCEVEGSEKLLKLVNEHLQTNEMTNTSDSKMQPEERKLPRVFLSYAGEDKEIATAVATQLTDKGIYTVYAEWDFNAGDSLRQKIDTGLSDCTHAIILFTPRSRNKQWPNMEMDAAVALKAAGKMKLIVLRHDVEVSELPPLFAGYVSPSVVAPNFDVTQLANDIHGVTRRPTLGPSRFEIEQKESTNTSFSAAANVIARLFVESSLEGQDMDPQFSREEMLDKANLTEDDLDDALHELRDFLTVDKWDGDVRAKHQLFARFDRFWKEWNPETDALRLGADMLNDEKFPTDAPSVASRYEWPARRLNAALSYMLDRNLLNDDRTIGSWPWVLHWLRKTDDLRRFVRSRN